MSFSMEQGHEVSQTVTHKKTMSQRQDVAIQQTMLQRQRELVEAVCGIRYQPHGDCGQCGHRLTDLEILKGFRDDPRDYTTECPLCHWRFEPRLHASTQFTSLQIMYLCPTQTLDKLASLQNTPLDEIKSLHATAYHSALTHFGGLKQAFAQLGMEYAFEADLDWRKKVVPFLGKLPDTVIAKLLGASVWQVRRLRAAKSIAPFRVRDLPGQEPGILEHHVDEERKGGEG